MAKEKDNKPEEPATENIGEDAIINETAAEEPATAVTAEPSAAKTDDDARLENLIEVHRSLARTRGQDQEFEFTGRAYKVFQDGVVQIVQTDEPE